MRCPTCTSTMKAQILAEHDLADVFGLKSVMVKSMPAHVCGACGEVLLLGPVIEALKGALRHRMLTENFPFVGAEIRFLRKLAGLTQQRLGDLLGVDRVTVARWEGLEDEPIGVPESIAIRTIIRAMVGEPAATAAFREPPRPRPRRFELRAPSDLSF